MAYEYDNCGNTTKRTIYKEEGEDVIVFEYDTMNRLVKTTEGADVTEYFYDNAGNRFIKINPAGTTVYLRHGQIAVAMDIELPVDTTEELGCVNRYVLSGDLLAGRITTIVPAVGDPVVEKSYYHLDHLNSTKCVTDEDGVVVVMYEYRAFGEQLKRLDGNGDETGDEAKYSYGGKELDDDTNLYYFNARYYDATIGRFINVDPVQDGSNWYVYCNNNPLCFVDPTGLEGEDIEPEALPTTTPPPDETAKSTPDPNATPLPDNSPGPQSNSITKEYDEWEKRYRAVTTGNLEEMRTLFNDKDEALTFIDTLQTSMKQSVNEMQEIKKNAKMIEDFCFVGSFGTGTVTTVAAIKGITISASMALKLNVIGLISTGAGWITSRSAVELMDNGIKKSEGIINDLKWISKTVKDEY
ncbi:MAG: hypothetical protein JXJ04_19530 [Spirochaetales bacterium]|nr:hypothetical protein [Spirochaetales bacterium]